MKLRLGPIVAIALAWCVMTGAAQAQPVLQPPTVVAANITLSWTPGTGDSAFLIQAGLAPGAYLASFPVTGTSVSVPAPGVGVYYARVIGNVSGPSNEIQIVVTTMVLPPAVPSAPQAFRNGSTLILNWAPGAGGGAPTGYLLRAGTSPGATTFSIPTAGPSFATGGVPAGTYYLGVRAGNGAGVSAESAETTVTMPGCDAPPAPVLTTAAWGTWLTASWTPIPGATHYIFSYNGPGFVGQMPFGPGATTFSFPSLPMGTWNFGVQAVMSCGTASAVGQSVLVVDGASLRMQPRAPDPAPGTALPGPAYLGAVVADIAARFPGDLRNSCVEHGGNNRWLFRLVAELRTRDKRWGLNWKRANVGDMSQDVITYNWSDEPDEGTFKLRAWDVIGGHCGNNPSGQASEITNPRPPAFSFDARWTLVPYIRAGFQP